MTQEMMLSYFSMLSSDWSILGEVMFGVVLLVMVYVAIYDRFIQRKNQLLINYPLVGRLRYLFYLLRDPMRQYFGDETFFDSFEKLGWINKVAAQKNPYLSFSPAKPYGNQKILFKHANFVKEDSEIEEDFSVIFGSKRQIPFVSKSIIGRSAMSDGAISPEGTRAFAKGAYIGQFPINTGEGGLTSNFLSTLKCTECNNEYLQIKEGTWFAKTVYKIMCFVTNKEVAQRVYRKMVVRQKDRGTFIFDRDKMLFFRIDWSKSLKLFPKKVPSGVPDIIFQMGSGLYGVRDGEGKFDPQRYKKVMRFCRMSEIKIAQGAKQTGGKLLASKVSDDISYYRGVKAHEDLISPNRFPFADDVDMLFDFVEELQNLSKKPVGFKIVLASRESFDEFAHALKLRISEGKNVADFITIDGGDGGSATAPLEMMSRVGLCIGEALVIVDETLKSYGIRDQIKIIASQKVLTPDDVVELFCFGADFINIARGFMISAGCIRARECSGANGRDCPVGLATMNEAKRSKYLVEQKAKNIANYHSALLKGVSSLLAIMGKDKCKMLCRDDLIMKNGIIT